MPAGPGRSVRRGTPNWRARRSARATGVRREVGQLQSTAAAGAVSALDAPKSSQLGPQRPAGSSGEGHVKTSRSRASAPARFRSQRPAGPAKGTQVRWTPILCKSTLASRSKLFEHGPREPDRTSVACCFAFRLIGPSAPSLGRKPARYRRSTHVFAGPLLPLPGCLPLSPDRLLLLPGRLLRRRLGRLDRRAIPLPGLGLLDLGLDDAGRGHLPGTRGGCVVERRIRIRLSERRD
ncbi:hypothetical protein DFJ74DRAFT_686779 [Hyaloraphidium curvatum]|nr:hypothetical protein DFJ74DRAFT_686779 [Hyaloraphidium curvatum]